MNNLTQSEAVLVLAEWRGKMLVFSLAVAPLSLSHDATQAVNLLYCRSTSVALGQPNSYEIFSTQAMEVKKLTIFSFIFLLQFGRYSN